jgi:hypothetical protein
MRADLSKIWQAIVKGRLEGFFIGQLNRQTASKRIKNSRKIRETNFRRPIPIGIRRRENCLPEPVPTFRPA